MLSPCEAHTRGDAADAPCYEEDDGRGASSVGGQGDGDDASARRGAGCGDGGERVAVVGMRGRPELIAAMLGVWRAGCTPVPMSHSVPPARIAAMVKAAGCTTALLAGPLSAAIAGTLRSALGSQYCAVVEWPAVLAPQDVVGVEDTEDHAHAETVRRTWPSRHPNPDADGYVLFTSGTTREPLACRGTIIGLVSCTT